MAKYYVYDFLKQDIPISQPYGVNPQLYLPYGLPYHEGVDFETPDGTEIFSPFDGIIVRDSYDPKAYGNYLVVWDPIQLCAVWFCHLQDMAVKISDHVKAGDLIGHTNNTGHSTGPHCHVNFVETNSEGMRINMDNGCQGFLNIMDPNLVDWRPFGGVMLTHTETTVQVIPPVAEASNSTTTLEELQNKVLDLTIQRNDALAKSKDLEAQLLQCNTNYSAFLASGYTSVMDVDKVLQEVKNENKDLTQSLIAAKGRNSDLASAIKSLEEEDAGGLKASLNAKQAAQDAKDTTVAVASVLKTKPDTNAILTAIDSIVSKYEQTKQQLIKTQVTEPVVTKVEVPTPQNDVPKESASQWLRRVFGFRKKVNAA